VVPEAINVVFNYSTLCAPGEATCGWQAGSTTAVAVRQRMNDVLDAFPLESHRPCFSVAVGFDDACLAVLATRAYEVRCIACAGNTVRGGGMACPEPMGVKWLRTPSLILSHHSLCETGPLMRPWPALMRPRPTPEEALMRARNAQIWGNSWGIVECAVFGSPMPATNETIGCEPQAKTQYCTRCLCLSIC